MKTSKWKRLPVIAVTSAVLMLAGQQSAAANIYTWMNKKVNPNGTVYTDSSVDRLSKNFSRTGVSAKIDKANGFTWLTTVWFNGYSTTGADSASISGPRSFGTTKARFTFRPGTGSRDRINVRAWLLNAQMAGLKGGAPSGDDFDGSGGVAGSESTTSVSASDLRNDGVDGMDIAFEAKANGATFWSGETDNGQKCLFIARGEYVGETCTDIEHFADHGMSQTMQGPGFSIQAVLVPDGTMDEVEADAAGIELVTDSLAVNNGEAVNSSMTLTDGVQHRIEVDIVAPE